MPACIDPPRGWIASANNRLAPNDYAYPLFGCWSNGWRARRIREMIEARSQHSPADMQSMHQDAKSLRAAALVPLLIPLLEDHSDARVREAAIRLRDWDCCCEPDSQAVSIFNVFFTCWCRTVALQRFDAGVVELMSGAIAGCAARLLTADPAGWFEGDDRRQRIVESFEQALDLLTERLGPDMQQWTWGRLHRMPLKHVLSERGDLSALLDHGGAGVRGDMVTVCNTGSDTEWSATTGAGYRLVADLSREPPVLQAIDVQSQSGHPGSPHYSDQHETWQSGR